MIWDIDLIFGMRVYNHKLQINFEINSGWMILANLQQLGLKFAQIFSCHHILARLYEVQKSLCCHLCVVVDVQC